MTSLLRRFWSETQRQKPATVIAAITMIACSQDSTSNLPEPARISLAPLEASLLVGETERFTAQAYNARNRPMEATFTWSSSGPTVASVDRTSGLVTAIAPGTATVIAAAGRITASASVSVLAAGPAKLSTSPSTLSLIVGGTNRVIAQVFDANGRLLAVPIQWISSNSEIATVTTDGIVTAIAAGTTTVTAKAGTLAASVTVSVVAVSGSVILFARYSNRSIEGFSSEVMLYAVSDNALTPLSPGGDLGSIAAPTWSPDGSQVAAEAVQTLFYDDINHWTDYASDLHIFGESPLALTNDGQSRKPDWSRDGSRIAFLKRPAQSSGSHLYVIDATGGTPTRLTQAEGSYDTPRWSPDGTRLAFSNVNDTQRDVYTMNADGTGVDNITSHAAYDAEPSWSPDGWKIAFVSTRFGGKAELFVVASNGGSVRRLTSLGGSIAAPVWSPDGSQIVFTLEWSPSADWPSGVYVVNADGSSLTQLIAASSRAVDLAFAWRASPVDASIPGSAARGAVVAPGIGSSISRSTSLTASMQFGQPDAGSPFPPSASHDQSAHARDNIVPRTVVIDRGGTVTFVVPAGTHQIAIYAPGKEPRDINSALLTPTCPGSQPRLINDPVGRLALFTHSCGSAWQAQYTFATPGRYLVICAVLPHFQVGMYGWVEVRDRGS